MTAKYALLLATLMALPASFAQRPEPQRPAQAPGAQAPAPARDPRAQEPSGPRPNALTPAERAKLQEITARNREALRPLAEKLRAIRVELDQLTRADKLDAAAIRAKAAQLGEAEGELAILRAQQYQELKAALPPEKLQAIRGVPGVPPARVPAEASPAPSPQLRQRLEKVVTPRQAQPAPARRVPGKPQPDQPPRDR